MDNVGKGEVSLKPETEKNLAKHKLSKAHLAHTPPRGGFCSNVEFVNADESKIQELKLTAKKLEAHIDEKSAREKFKLKPSFNRFTDVARKQTNEKAPFMPDF